MYMLHIYICVCVIVFCLYIQTPQTRWLSIFPECLRCQTALPSTKTSRAADATPHSPPGSAPQGFPPAGWQWTATLNCTDLRIDKPRTRG